MPSENQSITLDELLAEFPGVFTFTGDQRVTGITSDSRKVENGNLFVALSGTNWDGHKFIPNAIHQGASVIVGSEAITDLPVPYLQVPDTRESLATLSAAFYRYPARELVMIGVTGTDGKTTTCHLIHSILAHAGYETGVISTVNAMIGEESIDTGFHVTTPEAPDVQRLLRLMVDRGLRYAVIETTSHSLAQKRVIPSDFDIGVCTNITHEHLDYHQSFDAYRLAKASLFEGLATSRGKKRAPVGAVINVDDASCGHLTNLIKVPLVTYGFKKNSNFQASAFREYTTGSLWTLTQQMNQSDLKKFSIQTRFYGKYNVYNCLAAIATTAGILGIQVDQAENGISRLQPIPGRMERIDLGQDFDAFVDFAHTPNALKQVLMTARNIVKRKRKPGKVIAIFGSAGLRDKGKRKIMAEVSAEFADFTILTAEDPRIEDLAGILRDMASGMDYKGCLEGSDYVRIPDRGEAIIHGVNLASRGDVVLVCGKGHEQSMCFGDIEYPWDDRIAVRVAIGKKMGMLTDEIPHLPTRGMPT